MDHENRPLELLSYRICPFVARTLAFAEHQGIELSVRYIDIDDKPAWFSEQSPTGQVPALRVGDRVLFESQVIIEYLNEDSGAALHPSDPLEKAEHRAWSSFADRMIFSQYRAMVATQRQEYQQHCQDLQSDFQRLEARISSGPFFAGTSLHLIDFAMAPVLCRSTMLARLDGVDPCRGLAKLARWRTALAGSPAIAAQFDQEFEAAMRAHMVERGSLLVQ